MPLLATREAIGAVSEAVRSQLQFRSSVLCTVSRPEALTADSGPKLNLFLYQLDFDGQLKNHSLDEGRPAPLWLVLRYLLTAYDQAEDSDSIAAHRLLSRGLAALQEMSLLRPTVPALADNPEPLKLTFDTCDVDLMSKLMPGSEDKYRVSAAFQVRPVLIVPDELPSFAPPVLTIGPPGAEGVVVLPSLGPRLNQVTPSRFEVGATLELSGDDVNASLDTVLLGPLLLPVTSAREGAVRTQVPAVPALSAGYHPVVVGHRLPSGRLQTSNPQFAMLLPTVTGIVVGALTPNGPNLFGNVTITGHRLGGADDAVFVAFYRDGSVVLNLEVAGTAAQTGLVASVDLDHALPPGTYYLIVRVNGAQALQTPAAVWQP
jgi:hypothetical protein